MVAHNEAFKRIEHAIKSLGFRLMKANLYTGWLYFEPPTNQKRGFTEMRVWVDTKGSVRSSIQIICEQKTFFGFKNGFKSFEEEEEKILEEIKEVLRKDGGLQLIPR